MKMWLMLILKLVLFIRPVYSAFNPLDGIDADCQYDFINQTVGSFHSPGFSSGVYSTNLRCGWIIEYGVMNDFMLSFHVFRLENVVRCNQADYIKLFKFDQGSGWNTIGSQTGYCGRMEPFTVTASAQKLFIKFASNSNTNSMEMGFNISFVVKPQLPPMITYIGSADHENAISDVMVEEGDILTLQCQANDTRPAPTFKWNKLNNGTVGTIRSDIILSQTNGGMLLRNFEVEDTGIYQCLASNIYGTDTKNINIIISKRCPCPRSIKVTWMEIPPYTYYYNKNMVRIPGIIDTILTKMISKICGSCAKLEWNEMNKKKNLISLDDAILDEESTTDIYLPLQSAPASNRYRLKYYFLPIMSSPGMAHFVKQTSVDNSELLWNSIKQGWPICVMTVVLAVLAGIIIWSLDTYWNEEQFPRAFSEGIVEGFWWAIISMTTVGYGDIAPVSVPARIFAIAWILTGLVIVAIFTSVLSATLTVTVLSSQYKIYGAKTGALRSSVEFRQGVMKSANMSEFDSIQEMKLALDNDLINGILIDSYAAGYHSNKLGGYHLNKVFKTRKIYGFVLGRRLSSSEFYQKFQGFYESNKEDILALVVNSTLTPKKRLRTNAMSSADDLISDDNRFFKWTVQISAIVFGILVVGGLSFEYGYLRPRHRMIASAKKTDLCHSKAVKEMVFRTDLLKITLCREVKLLKIRWAFKMSALKQRHQIELKKFKKKMKPKSSHQQMEMIINTEPSTSQTPTSSQC